MKIAIVSPVMNPVPPQKYGGIEIIVNELAVGLAGRNHQVTVFCAGRSRINGQNLYRVETSPYPTAGKSNENRRWEANQILEVISRQNEFDIIHFNYEPLVLQFNINNSKINLMKFLRRPAVFTFHNITTITKNIRYYRNNNQAKDHYMVFISKSQREPLAKLFLNCKVIYNGIKIENYAFENQKENYLLFLGRITRAKGILKAIKVSRKTKIPLVIAAKVDQADRSFYEKEIRPKIDGKLIKYIGEVDFNKKLTQLKKARCLLFPALWEEPFGLVMVESLACGTPVVAFRRGSVPEIIKNGINGYVVGNTNQMIKAINGISAISPQVCRDSVKDCFDSSRMVNEYESFFLNIADSRKH